MATEEESKLYEASSSIILRWDKAGTIRYVNKAGLGFFGYSAEELIGQDVRCLIPGVEDSLGRDLSTLVKNIFEAPAEHVVYENENVTKEGKTVWIAWTNQAILNEQGEVIEILAIGNCISALKESEEKLAKEKSFLRAVIDSAEDLIYFKDRNSTYVGYNKASEAFTGLAECEQIGKSDFELFDRAQAEAIVKDDQNIFESRTALHTEDWVTSPVSGEQRILDTVKAPIIGLDGQTIGLVGISRDITKRKKAEREFTESQNFNQNIIDNSPFGLLVFKESGPCVLANPAAENIVGGTSEQILQLNFREMKTYKKTGIFADMEEALRTGAVIKKEIHTTNTFGKEVWFEGVISTFQRNEEKHILYLFNDIMEGKKSEEILKKNKERQRTIYQAAFDGVWCTDMQGRLLEVNQSYCQMSGYSESELLSMHIRDLEANENIEDISAHILRIKTEGQDRFESCHRRKDGSLFDVEVSSRYLAIDDGCLVVFIRDISERINSDREKAEMERQLHQMQKIESIGQLAGGVAHDFNNILGVILGHTELALRKADPSSSLISDLEENRKAANRAAELTRQLLTFARKQAINPKVLDLNEAVSGTLKMLQRLIGENIQLSWNPAAELWPVKVDPSQLDQILANLCVNSRDAISGTGKISIKTQNTSWDEDAIASHPYHVVPGDYVLIGVSDDGCGMDKKVQDHIFEPFYTTKEVGSGTGLGLATVYGAVKQNHGFFTVYSEPGLGTVFNIYLPRMNTAVEAKQDAAESPVLCGSETILLVEDDEMVLQLVMSMLEESGYTVLAAATTPLAEALAREHPGPIHLLMSDMIMPIMNGRELSEKLKPLRPDMKVLFLSGYTADIISSQGVIEDKTCFLQKPFSLEELTSKVREVLDDH